MIRPLRVSGILINLSNQNFVSYQIGVKETFSFISFDSGSSDLQVGVCRISVYEFDNSNLFFFSIFVVSILNVAGWSDVSACWKIDICYKCRGVVMV